MKRALSIATIWSAVALGLLLGAPAARGAENLAMKDEKTSPPAIVVTLQKVTDGLQMMSETDAPFKVVFFELPAAAIETKTDEKAETDAEVDAEKRTAPQMNAAQIAKLVGAPDEAEIETRELDDFFRASTTVEDWMNDEEKASAARFVALLQVLKTELKDAQVVLWGDAEKQVAIVGTCEGGAAGVTTLIVET